MEWGIGKWMKVYKGILDVSLIFLISIIFFIGITSGVNWTVTPVGCSVSIDEDKYYSEGNTVDVRVCVLVGVENAIRSIELKPSIEGWPSQTLYSGGKRDWGSSITVSETALKSGKANPDCKEVKFIIPSNLSLENQTVNLTFVVPYYYAKSLREGKKEYIIIGERNFEDKGGCENIFLDLKIYNPEEKRRLIEERKAALLEIKEKKEAFVRFVRKAALYLVVLIPITIFLLLLIAKWKENMTDFVNEAIGTFFAIVLLIEIILLLIFGILVLLTLF